MKSVRWVNSPLAPPHTIAAWDNEDGTEASGTVENEQLKAFLAAGGIPDETD